MTWSVMAAIAGIAAVVASIATVGLKLATCAYVMRWGGDLANNLATPRLSRDRQNGFPS